jgi:predicted regulator of Ras-like GTPase activity (Roadblock/LC7/MglB family)
MTPVTTPRYRYREEAPQVIPVPARELLERIPPELRGSAPPAESQVELPVVDLLSGNTPRLAIGCLEKIAPGLVRIPEGRVPEEKIPLPPGWIALYFRMVTRREELPPEEVGEQALDDGGRIAAPSGTATPAGESPEGSPAPESSSTESVSVIQPDAGESEVVAIVVEDLQGDSVPPSREQPTPPKKGFFSSLPMFRRTEPREKQPPPPLRPRPEVTGLADPGTPVKETSDIPEGRELIPTAQVLERLWKLDPQDELADGSALQALFMTDEKLTLEKVVSKAGELPGLDACVLAHGDRVICASKAPADTDLQTLSGQAMAMLSHVRDSSEKMGLGSVPAVTLHADRGVVSFLHRGELCLLVLHADRGFVPGVRERLQEMLGHLSEARPSLPPAPAP